MDEDRRNSRSPGRREEDALTRELVRALLHEEGYLNMDANDKRYITRTDRAGRADWTVRIIGLVIIGMQLVDTILVNQRHP